MALPTDPTATTIKTEAFARAKISTPSAAQLLRGDLWIQEIFDEIWLKSTSAGDTRLKSLETEAILIPALGTNFVDLPEDFDEEISIILLDGDDRGTAQAGGAAYIDLAAAEDVTEANAVGKLIVITGGTGARQSKRIVAYNPTTKRATVDSAWTTNPDNTSTYLLVRRTRSLSEDSTRALDEVSAAPASGKPSYFSKYNRRLLLDRPFDTGAYAVLLRYFMHINQVDLSEGAAYRFTRLLREWRTVIINGLLYKIWEDMDDNRWIPQQQKFDALTTNLLIKEIAYGGAFEGFTL